MNQKQLLQTILDHWRSTSPQTAKAQPPDWRERQASAQADLARAETNAIRMPGVTDNELWSEVARDMLIPCPTIDDEPEA